MEGGWLISYLVLWCLTILLSLVILAHSRLIGLLHHRFGPAAARPMADGPEVGTKLRPLYGLRLDGSDWNLGFPSPFEVVLIFVSPQCKTCNELIPHVKDFARVHREVEVALISTVDHLAMNRAYVDYQKLERMPYIIGAKMADDLNIEGTPYALYLSCEGVVISKGLVNHYEHLSGLIHTKRSSEAEIDRSGTDPAAHQKNNGRDFGVRTSGRWS